MTHENCEALEAADNEKKCVSDLKEEAERLTPSSSVLDSSAMATRGDNVGEDWCFNRDDDGCFTHHRVSSRRTLINSFIIYYIKERASIRTIILAIRAQKSKSKSY